LRAQQRHHPIYIYIFVCIHTIIYLCACSSYRYKLYNCIGNYIIHIYICVCVSYHKNPYIYAKYLLRIVGRRA
jgi:Na+-translocating ferredoxin:NAD+ oxidoreductase RnfE subunit